MKEKALDIRAQFPGALELPNGCVFNLQCIGNPVGDSIAIIA